MGLKERYKDEIVPAMMETFDYDSVMQVPRLEKVVFCVFGDEARRAYETELGG